MTRINSKGQKAEGRRQRAEETEDRGQRRIIPRWRGLGMTTSFGEYFRIDYPPLAGVRG
ncbi:MAG: hypothetical protein AB1422_09610 [bacterium]